VRAPALPLGVARYSVPAAVELPVATTTSAGLRVQAESQRGVCRLVMKVSGAALPAVPLAEHGWQGEWNCNRRVRRGKPPG
jgi:hypothetical protein